MHIIIHMCMCIYIHIYREREIRPFPPHESSTRVQSLAGEGERVGPEEGRTGCRGEYASVGVGRQGTALKSWCLTTKLHTLLYPPTCEASIIQRSTLGSPKAVVPCGPLHPLRSCCTIIHENPISPIACKKQPTFIQPGLEFSKK